MTTSLAKDALVAVVGAGAMGAGIAQVAAVAGHKVLLLDNRPEAARLAVEGLRAQLNNLASKGKLTAEVAQAAGQRLQAATQISDLADAALVVEAIVENLQAKQTLFSDLELLVSADCIFGSNTSSISITAIGSALKHPQRLAGLHFFNPAPVMALVEVVAGLATAPQVVDTLHATATAWGKTAVHAKSTPGFIVNRVARPYYAEALRLRTESAADCATLDAVMRESGGFRMGPFELMDMIGLDVNFAVTRSVWNAYFNDPRYLPSLIQQELVDAGYLGKKSGRGYYDYRDGAEKPQAQTEPSYALPSRIVVCGDTSAAQALAARLQVAGVTFERAASTDGRIAETDAAVLFVTDGRSATQRAAESGIANTVLIDLALDYSKATRVALAHAGQCCGSSFAATCAVLQAAGLQVSRLADVPGLAVMRTVAMLANEAADAVYQGVCTARAADDAMRLGVNYPAGPLAWADRVGLGTIHVVLSHLNASYGEDRYRISPLIQRQVFQGKDIHG
nr:3-hydroxyacyl-CoA dehydrogenase PaaH [uncultured Albidiferax sp.]